MITYRKISIDDYSNFNSLYKKIESQSNFMLYEKDERKTTDEQQKATLERIQNDPSTTIILAEDNGTLVGFIGIIGDAARKRRHSRYVAMGIINEYHGKKIGSGLMEKCISFCSAQNVKRIELTVVVANENAVNLYKKYGFEIEGIKRCSLIINEIYEDEYYMSKIM